MKNKSLFKYIKEVNIKNDQGDLDLKIKLDNNSIIKFFYYSTERVFEIKYKNFYILLKTKKLLENNIENNIENINKDNISDYWQIEYSQCENIALWDLTQEDKKELLKTKEILKEIDNELINSGY